MKYPNYDENEIQETLDTYSNFDNDELPPVFKGTGITKNSPEYNVNSFLKLYDAETFKLSHKEFVKLLTKIKNIGLLDDTSVIVINKLIGDRKLYKKIRFCRDGSYRNNRIWGHAIKGAYQIEPTISFGLWKQFGKRYPVDDNKPKAFIDWLYNHFDIIFLQIPSDSKFLYLDIKMDIEEGLYDEMYLDIDSYYEEEDQF